MIHTLEMTVLIDNVAAEPLVGEWGLSILITADDRSILLDTGASHLFAQNAERLGIDLNSVDTGVLSHAHYDHSDGMDTFFSLNRKAPFLVREGTCENCFGIKDGALHYIGIQSGILKQHEARIQYVGGVYKIADGLWLVPHRKSDYTAIAMRNDLYTVCGQDRRPDGNVIQSGNCYETKEAIGVSRSTDALLAIDSIMLPSSFYMEEMDAREVQIRIDEYYSNGDFLHPLSVVRTSKGYLLRGGYSQFKAAQELGLKDCLCRIGS
ncbi:MAG: MBL fold metallo-hydrolase [Clostridia bacterium]|nr:MBL fold metallo-hydrolase [Clostridia bacterium]